MLLQQDPKQSPHLQISEVRSEAAMRPATERNEGVAMAAKRALGRETARIIGQRIGPDLGEKVKSASD